MMQLDLMAAPSARRFAAYHRPGGNPNSAEMREVSRTARVLDEIAADLERVAGAA
jgi:hypothetical protein